MGYLARVGCSQVKNENLVAHLFICCKYLMAADIIRKDERYKRESVCVAASGLVLSVGRLPKDRMKQKEKGEERGGRRNERMKREENFFFKEKGKWENITRATIRPGLASLPLTGIASAPHRKTAPSQKSYDPILVVCDSICVAEHHLLLEYEITREIQFRIET